jgi:hypothetical protein
MIVVRVAWLLLFVAAVAAVVAQARSPRPDRAAVAIAVVRAPCGSR